MAELHCLFLSLQNIFNLFDISLIILNFYTNRSMTMFFKVLNKVKLFLITDLVLFAKLLELLAINHGLSERRIIFVPRLLKFSHVLVVLQLEGVHTSPQLSWITPGLAPFRGCQVFCDIVPNGPSSSVVPFNKHQGLKY